MILRLWYLDCFRECSLLLRESHGIYSLGSYAESETRMALVTGVVAERGRLMPFLIFSVFWTTFVYDPIAYWLWNSNGWANRLGALDWAGGTPVRKLSIFFKFPSLPY